MTEQKTTQETSIKAMHIRLEGYIDSETCIDFEESITSFLEQGKRFILLDCRNLKYVSDAGIGALISTAKKFEKEKACLVFYDMPDELSRVINFLNIHENLIIAKSKEKALELLKKCVYAFQKADEEIISKEADMEEEMPVQEIKDDNVHGEEENDLIKVDEIDESLDEFDDMLEKELESQEEIGRVEPEMNSQDINLGKINLDNEISQIDKLMDEGTSVEKKIGKTFRVVECAHCHQLSKVKKSGHYSCPKCSKEFSLEDDGTVIFN